MARAVNDVELIRYARGSDDQPKLAVKRDGELYAVDEVDRVADLLRLRAQEFRSLLTSADRHLLRGEQMTFLPPVDGDMEVWASGVTYEMSRDARVEESTSADVYEAVYGAERPELFFKSAGWRVVTDGEPIGLREDSEVNVPEPELGVFINRWAEVVGFAVCNDVSSRSIEGANPLYLPQAKVYAGSCAVSAAVKPAWEIPDPNALGIEVTVWREETVVWQASTSTARMHRSLAELTSFLFRGENFPDGVLLLTGTGVVPQIEFGLRAGDRVDVSIERVGQLSNVVVVGKDHFGWLESARRAAGSRTRS